MFSRIAILTLAAWLAWAGTANAAEDKKWICIPDAATGFAYKNGQWRQAKFTVEGDKYIVAIKRIGDVWPGATNEDSRVYFVTKIGESARKGTPCESNKPNSAGYLFCKLFEEYRINVKTLRFIRTYTLGFADGKDNNDNTPLIEIGKCSPL